MSWFLTWSISWPKLGGQQAAAGRYDLHIAWQPELDDDTPIKFSDIVAGVHDDYLTRFFTAAKNHPGQVVIRFAHEMNGDGYPWSAAISRRRRPMPGYSRRNTSPAGVMSLTFNEELVDRTSNSPGAS